jgi:hypothetical protein
VRLLPAIGALFVAGVGFDCGHARESLLEPARGEMSESESTSAAVDGPAAFSAETPPAITMPEPLAPATRYAALSADACAAELAARAIPHEKLGPTRGVAAPVRLTGALSGVTFRTLLPERLRVHSPYEIYDCRLLLALDDFAKLLAAQRIVEVIHYSAYRPPPAGWSDGPFGLRHEGGLAIDVGYFRSVDGTALNVERDFVARPAERPCAPGRPPRSATAESIALRRIACDGVEARLFHLTLTPDYDRTHRDHFHFEVTPGVNHFVAR